MPDKIISYDNLTRFKEDLDVVLDDKQDVLVNGENIKSVNGASILGSGDVDTNGNIAPAFSTSSTYEVGDVVVYEHVLYKCITAISTAGAWDSSKWSQTTVAESVLGLINTGV